MSDFNVRADDLHRCGVHLVAYQPPAFAVDLPGNFVLEEVVDAVAGLGTRSSTALRDGGMTIRALGDGLRQASIDYKIADGWPR